MRNFIVIPAFLLLCCFFWSSKPDVFTVEQGLDTIMLCRNISASANDVFVWSRLVEETKYNWIASMNGNSRGKCCTGFKDRFEISSNGTFVFLKIMQVKMADSGFYFCGLNVVGSGVTVVRLNVTGDYFRPDPETVCHESNVTLWISLVSGGVCVLLIMVIIRFGLKIRRYQAAQTAEQNNAQRQNMISESLNYATVHFQPKPRQTHRAVPNESTVIYAATR